MLKFILKSHTPLCVYLTFKNKKLHCNASNMGIARLDKVLANLFSLRAEEFEKSGKPDRTL
ncbi:hypothetical protein, partial [Fervidicoccus sp.]|uniref:hypothetical protein n=1 Tax=Fervidicoccus sp. TaxID=2060324 RepID=UPI003D139AE1